MYIFAHKAGSYKVTGCKDLGNESQERRVHQRDRSTWEKQSHWWEGELRDEFFYCKGRAEWRGHSQHSARLRRTAGLICCVAELQILMWCNNPCFWDTRGHKWIIKPTHLCTYTYCIHSFTHALTHTSLRWRCSGTHTQRHTLRDSTAFMWTQGYSSASACVPIPPEEPVTP